MAFAELLVFAFATELALFVLVNLAAGFAGESADLATDANEVGRGTGVNFGSKFCVVIL